MNATSARARIGAVAWSLSFVVLGYVSMGGLAVFVLTAWGRRDPAIWASPTVPALVQAASGLAVYGLLSWAIGAKAMGLSARDLGWPGLRDLGAGFARGFLVAAGLGLGALVLGLAAHNAWTLDGGSFGAYLARLALLSLVLLPPALMEEVAFRGAPLAAMARGIGRTGAIVVMAGLFAAAHLRNPDVTRLALANIALAGVFLGLTFFARGGMGTATGAHVGWNLALAGSAASVSGLPFDIPWIDYRPGAPSWVTGGAFGPEGGVVATVMLLAGVAIARRWQDSQETI